MPTELLFRDDAYLKETTATVEAVTDQGGVVLDRTILYAMGGGQPGDRGRIRRGDGSEIAIVNTAYDKEDRSRVIHLAEPGAELPSPGESVTLLLDWEIRHPRMRIHTALHLLSVVLPYPVTGGSVRATGGLISTFPRAASTRPRSRTSSTP